MKNRRLQIAGAVVASIATNLWLGGLVMLFYAVSSLFATLDRHTAGIAATAIFTHFQQAQIVVAGVAIVAVEFCLQTSRRKNWIGGLLITAAVLAIAIAFVISPRIDALRLAGETDSDAFKHLHGASMAVYLLMTLIVLVANALLAWSLLAEPTSAPVPSPFGSGSG